MTNLQRSFSAPEDLDQDDMMTANAPQRSSQGRFDLPGLNLPLNWTPHEEYHRSWGENPYYFPSQGDGKNLFPTALDDAHLEDSRCM